MASELFCTDHFGLEGTHKLSKLFRNTGDKFICTCKYTQVMPTEQLKMIGSQSNDLFSIGLQIGFRLSPKFKFIAVSMDVLSFMYACIS